MNKDEAKKILAFYRPGTSDRTDPVFNAAAELAKPDAGQGKPDPELSDWFKEHCASYLSIRTKFLKIPVPADLKERILAENAQRRPSNIILFRPAVLLRTAAVLAVILGLVFMVWPFRNRQDDFNVYRQRMARTAMQPYGMPVHSHDLQSIQSFLAEKHAPAKYVLPNGVLKAQALGCAIVRWQGAPVSMLCFHSGNTAAGADKPDLWLFVADQSSVRSAPGDTTPVIQQEMQLTTASWSRDGKTYVLAAAGDETFLRKYL